MVNRNTLWIARKVSSPEQSATTATQGPHIGMRPRLQPKPEAILACYSCLPIPISSAERAPKSPICTMIQQHTPRSLLAAVAWSSRRHRSEHLKSAVCYTVTMCPGDVLEGGQPYAGCLGSAARLLAGKSAVWRTKVAAEEWPPPELLAARGGDAVMPCAQPPSACMASGTCSQNYVFLVSVPLILNPNAPASTPRHQPPCKPPASASLGPRNTDACCYSAQAEDHKWRYDWR